MRHESSPLRASDPSTVDHLKKLTISELFGQADTLQAAGDPASAAAIYKNWIACNPGDGLLYAAYYNYGVALDKIGDSFGAINATRESIRLNPDFHPPYINLGRLLEDLGQAGDAVLQWQGLVSRLQSVNGESVKHKLLALHQIGRVLEKHQLDGAAEDALKQSLDISIAQPELVQHWIALRLRQCKWPIISGWDAAQSKTVVAGISPLSLANYLDDPMFQLAKAWKYNKDFITPANPRSIQPHSAGLERGRDKLRIGYVSSDLREHAVGFAMTDVFEEHDKSRFEIFAYYCGVDRADPIQRRIKDSADRWTDINGLSDEDAAARIREDEIDILVDLNGYTKDARTRVFSFRPAPIAVNWFGFPGTMGTPYHHYIIADEAIIPYGEEIYYSEKVERLSCYQPNDRKRLVSPNRPLRSDEGLPEDAFVYCCLNGAQKITPPMFARWMMILTQVPGSVLWLLGATDETNARLKGLAERSGIAPERVIVAEKRPNPEHVARYALADLFLDTFPYGAHTTAADAMWMGVPVLTIPGMGFASRVCTSLAQAGGIGDLVCPTPEVYVDRAIELGRDPRKVAEYKERLIAARNNSLLFDTPRLIRELEALYRGMWEEFQAGRRPVPELTNLDIYHEIGVELAAEGASPSTPDEYRRLYRDMMETRNCIDPIGADARLWKNSD